MQTSAQVIGTFSLNRVLIKGLKGHEDCKSLFITWSLWCKGNTHFVLESEKFHKAIPLLWHLHSLKAQPVSTVRRGKFVADSWLEGDVNAHFGARWINTHSVCLGPVENICSYCHWPERRYWLYGFRKYIWNHNTKNLTTWVNVSEPLSS